MLAPNGTNGESVEGTMIETFRSFADWSSALNLEARRCGGNRDFFASQLWAIAFVSKWPRKYTYALGSVSGELCGQKGFFAISVKPTKTDLLLGKRLSFNSLEHNALQDVHVERNGFYIRSFLGDAEALFLSWLDGKSDWCFLEIPCVDQSQMNSFFTASVPFGYAVEKISEAPCYSLSLNSIRNNFASAIDSFSPGLRQQLRRSRRKLEHAFGELVAEEATDKSSIETWYEDLCHLHTKRWARPPRLASFEVPEFKDLHRQLLSGAERNFKASLVRICAGQVAVGYMLYYIGNGTANFYLAGVDYARFASYRPGLLCHWLGIQLFLDRGLVNYDFLEGEAHYKSRFVKEPTLNYRIRIYRKPALLTATSIMRMATGFFIRFRKWMG